MPVNAPVRPPSWRAREIDATNLDSNDPSWTLIEPKRDWLGWTIMACCVLVIAAMFVGHYLANRPDEYDRIRQACPGKAVDVWSRDGELLAIRCEFAEPRS